MERGRPQSPSFLPDERASPQAFPLLLENASTWGDIQGRRPLLRSSDGIPYTTFPIGPGALEPGSSLWTLRNRSLGVPHQLQPQSNGTYAQGFSTATVPILTAPGYCVHSILGHEALHGAPPRGPATMLGATLPLPSPPFPMESYSPSLMVFPTNHPPLVGLAGTQIHFEGSGAHDVPGQGGRQTVVSFNDSVDLNTHQDFLPSASTQAALSSHPNCAVNQWNYQENPHTSTDKFPPGAYNTPFGVGHPTEACNSPSTPVPILHFPKTSNATRPIDLEGFQMEQMCRSSDLNVFQNSHSSASTQAMPPSDPNLHVGRGLFTAGPRKRHQTDRGRVVHPIIGSDVFHRFPPLNSIHPNPSVSQPDCHPGAPASAAPPYADNTPSTPAQPTPPGDPIACTRCGWTDEDGVICGHTIDYECQLHFAGVHGINNLSAHTIVSCRWCKPDYKLRRDGFLRHIREAHLGFLRSKRGRADRRLA